MKFSSVISYYTHIRYHSLDAAVNMFGIFVQVACGGLHDIGTIAVSPQGATSFRGSGCDVYTGIEHG